MKKVLQFFTPGWLVFYAFLLMMVPVRFYDFNEVKSFNETHQFGTITITSFNTGDWNENIFTMTMSSDSKHKYSIVVQCDVDTTIITGYSNYRSPDSQDATYLCEADKTLEIDVHGGWVTFAANGTAKKLSMRTYNVNPSVRIR